MKIGILTFHNAINYGAVLQCYALKEYLSLRGHDVEVIDYRNSTIEKQKKLLSLGILKGRKGFIGKLRYIVKNLLLYGKTCKSIRVFDSFIKKRLPLSTRIMSVNDMPSNYDCIIFGSDQIWNPRLCGGFDPVFWGKFAKNKTTFVTYAASIGEPSELDDNQWNRIEKLIKVFDRVSVREIELKRYLENKLRIESQFCLDPTLLVDSTCFDKIACRPKESDYVFLYTVQKDPKAIDFAKKLARSLKCIVIRGQAKPEILNHIETGSLLAESVSPEEFLGYIKYARYVVANSFHAIALSIVFKTNFYSLNCRKPGRVKNLLYSVGLSNRHVDSSDFESIILKDIDYTLCYKKMHLLQENSRNYIDAIG